MPRVEYKTGLKGNFTFNLSLNIPPLGARPYADLLCKRVDFRIPFYGNVDGRKVSASAARCIGAGGKKQRKKYGCDERRGSCFAI